MRREEIVALLILPNYQPISALLRKQSIQETQEIDFFRFMCVPVWVRTCNDIIFLASVSLAKQHLCGNSLSQRCSVDIGWYQSLHIFWNCSSQTCRRLLCTLCFVHVATTFKSCTTSTTLSMMDSAKLTSSTKGHPFLEAIPPYFSAQPKWQRISGKKY